MICLELVGHAVGDPRLPDDVRNTVFALGSERAVGLGEELESIVRARVGRSEG